MSIAQCMTFANLAVIFWCYIGMAFHFGREMKHFHAFLICSCIGVWLITFFSLAYHSFHRWKPESEHKS